MSAKGGPHAKPTALRRLAGDDKAGKDEAVVPDVDLDALEVPILSPGGEKVWKRLAPMLIKAGLLKAADVEAFTAYVEAVNMWQLSTDDCNRNGYVTDQPVYNRNGDISGYRSLLNPFFYSQKEANAVMIRYSGRFGLTPADRAALKLGDDGNKAKPAERYLTA